MRIADGAFGKGTPAAVYGAALCFLVLSLLFTATTSGQEPTSPRKERVAVQATVFKPKARSASVYRRMPDDSGRGEWPYNSRLIDDTLFAGGTPFHPQTPSNSALQVKAVLSRIRDLGIKTVIILNVPADDRQTREEEFLARAVGLSAVRLPMNAEKVPTADETAWLMNLIDGKAYVHCQWGADRTGAVVAKYLRLRHGFSGRKAWEAVIKGGSHAGRQGGLKIGPTYANLILYFWPEVTHEDREVCEKYKVLFFGD